MFHKVKGASFWKLRQFGDAMDHFLLAKRLLDHLKPETYEPFIAKLCCYIGQLHLENEDFDEATAIFTKGSL